MPRFCACATSASTYVTRRNSGICSEATASASVHGSPTPGPGWKDAGRRSSVRRHRRTKKRRDRRLVGATHAPALSARRRMLYPRASVLLTCGRACEGEQQKCASVFSFQFCLRCCCCQSSLSHNPTTRPFFQQQFDLGRLGERRVCFVTTNFGPATIFINDRGLCTLEGPPFPSCTLSGGTGAPDSPFDYSCTGSGPPIANCTSGTPFTLAGGQVDIDVDTHTVTTGAVPAAASVLFNPWVPIGSALGVALLAVGWQLRRRRT